MAFSAGFFHFLGRCVSALSSDHPLSIRHFTVSCENPSSRSHCAIESVLPLKVSE